MQRGKMYISETDPASSFRTECRLPIGDKTIPGELLLPPRPKGIVVFCYLNKDNKVNPRNTFIAQVLLKEGIGSLLFDIANPSESKILNLDILSNRLAKTIDFILSDERTKNLNIGILCVSEGIEILFKSLNGLKTKKIKSIFSRGGRMSNIPKKVDFANIPMLFVAGEHDYEAIKTTEELMKLNKGKNLETKIIKGATHLFEELGKLGEVSYLASQWFCKHF